MADSTSSSPSLPQLMLGMDGTPLWMYGLNSAKRAELEVALDAWEDFHVVDPETEQHLKVAIQQPFEMNKSGSEGKGVVHMLAQEVTAVPLLKRLLALGLHPDLPTWENFRPSHASCMSDGVGTAATLVVCRPDLLALSRDCMDIARTPAEFARLFAAIERCEAVKKLRLEILAVWNKAEVNGFPSIAQLAFEEKWWAVRNLSRRRVIGADEIQSKYQGKTATEWAQQHGKPELAKELSYLLQPSPSEAGKLSKRALALEPDVEAQKKRRSGGDERLEEAITCNSSSNSQEISQLKHVVASLEKELAEEIGKRQDMQQEIDRLKMELAEEKKRRIESKSDEVMTEMAEEKQS